MKNHSVKAQEKVSKAVGVFSQAIKEVEQAQEILTEGIKQDSFTITAKEDQIKNLQADIEGLVADKESKGDQIKSNTELLEKLKDFQ